MSFLAAVGGGLGTAGLVYAWWNSARAKCCELAGKFVALYGEGKNGDVTITKTNGNVFVEFNGIHFANPRSAGDGHFIQLFSHGDALRLEFPAERRLKKDGAVTLTLEECPTESIITNEQEYEAFLDNPAWVPLTSVHVRQNGWTFVESNEIQ